MLKISKNIPSVSEAIVAPIEKNTKKSYAIFTIQKFRNSCIIPG